MNKQYIVGVFRAVGDFFKKPGIVPSLVVILVASMVFAWRYQPAFTEANFYAEDGTVFIQTVYEKDPFSTLLTPFNGYLIAGQYLLAELSVDITYVLHLPFSSMPLVIAVLSCLFLGLTVSLPYVLLRKNIGVSAALTLVAVGVFVPLPGSDYAVIGTIGNLKFAFLYWAFILLLFRYWNAHSFKKVVLVDVALFFSVLTYAPAAALLPAALAPYLKGSLAAIKRRQFRYFLKPEILSLVVLAFLTFTYLLVVYLHGIPKLVGYLDTPYNTLASVKLLFRSTLYAMLFFVAPFLRDSIVLLLFAGVCWFGLRDRRSRWIFIFALWSIMVATISFVINRPGISDYFLRYGKTPDQFFYAQSLVFMFAIVWLAAPYVRKLKKWAAPVTIIGLVVFASLSLLFGGSGGKNNQIYKHLGPARQNIESACKNTHSETITLQIYPSDIWKWELPRNTVCR